MRVPFKGTRRRIGSDAMGREWDHKISTSMLFVGVAIRKERHNVAARTSQEYTRHDGSMHCVYIWKSYEAGRRDGKELQDAIIYPPSPP